MSDEIKNEAVTLEKVIEIATAIISVIWTIITLFKKD